LGRQHQQACNATGTLALCADNHRGLNFGLGIGCTGGWFGYTGGINGYNTAAYYLPDKDATIIAFVTAQIEKPDPGVANAIVRDFTRILFPQNIAYPSQNSFTR
jgi:hypothetical protein